MWIVYINFVGFSECGGHMQGTEGNIAFPNAIGGSVSGQNMDCVYLIQTEAGKIINITFTQFHLKGPAYYCNEDWLQVLNY